MELEKWARCGVGMDIAHLYGRGTEEDMTGEEQIEAGAYLFRGRLMIGGYLKAFARTDNCNVSCIGHMDSYFY